MPTLVEQTIEETATFTDQGTNRISILLPEGCTEEEKAACTREKLFRVNYMDEHNESPEKLACSIFPNPLRFKDKEHYELFAYEPKEYKKLGSLAIEKSRKAEVATIIRSLANMFIQQMKQIGLELDWIKSKRTEPWVDYLKDDDGIPDREMTPQRWNTGCTINFFCQHCIARGQLGLVAIGKASKKGKDDLDFSIHSLKILELYYHSVECGNTKTQKLIEYEARRSTVFPIPFAWVFGNRYRELKKQIDNHPKAGYYFDPDLSKPEIQKLKRQIKFGKEKAIRSNPERHCLRPFDYAWTSLGEPINRNQATYLYDDRSYCLLPGKPLENLKANDHHMSMSRLMYFLVCRLGIETDASPFSLDREKVKQRWKNNNKSALPSQLELYSRNSTFHLKMKEVSALFGGNERKICEKEPIHQFCHVDGVLEGGKMPEEDLFAPASFLVPLSEEGRSIYIGNKDTVIHVPIGSVLVFASDVLHGGLTRRFDEGRQQVAIHGHLDSRYIPREVGLLDISELGDYYLPEQHLMLYPIEKHLQYILQSDARVKRMMQKVQQTRAEEMEEHPSDDEDTKAILEEYKALQGERKKRKKITSKMPQLS